MKITQVVCDEKSQLCNKTALKWTRTFFCAHFKAGIKTKKVFWCLEKKNKSEIKLHSIKMLN